MDDPKISIVIVNYNGKQYLDACIDSIFSSNTAIEMEIIVVDNSSTDGSIEYLKTKYNQYQDRFEIVALDENYGPAKARNEGVKVAKGDYIGFLDNDTMVDPEWANSVIAEFEKDKNVGIIQCKLLLAKEKNKIDYVGEYLGQNGFLVQRARVKEIDRGQYDQKVNILAAKSAGMFIRKKVFDIIGGFDDNYFIYVEETDLAWRSWLAGYTTKFIPESVVYHEFGTSSLILGKNKNNYNAKYHGTKNYILTLFKNLATINLLKILPLHIFLWAGLGWYSLLRGNGKTFIWINKGIIWNISNLKKNLYKRKIIQQKRKITDKELFKIIMRKRPFSYFLHKVTVKCKVGNAEGFIKSQ